MRFSSLLSAVLLSFTLVAAESANTTDSSTTTSAVVPSTLNSESSELATSPSEERIASAQAGNSEKAVKHAKNSKPHTKKPAVAAAKKETSKKVTAKKATVKKATAKKPTTKKPTGKKTTTKGPVAKDEPKVAAVVAQDASASPSTANPAESTPKDDTTIAGSTASTDATKQTSKAATGTLRLATANSNTSTGSSNTTSGTSNTSAGTLNTSPSSSNTTTTSSTPNAGSSNTTTTSNTPAGSSNTTSTPAGSSNTTSSPSNASAGASNSTAGSSNTTTGSNNSTAASNNSTSSSYNTTAATTNTSPFNSTAAPANITAVSNNTTSIPTYQDGAKAVQTQLVSDVNTTIQALSGALTLNQANGTNTTMSGQATVQLMQNITANLAKYDVSQDFNANSTATALASMAKAVNATLNSIEAAAIKLLSTTDGAVQYHDLQKCILTLVQDGGLHDGSSCVTKNGISITGVSTIMSSVLDTFGGGVIPSDILTQASKALDPSFTAVIPAERYFYGNISAAFASVQAAISGDLVNAMSMAEKCFKQSMSQTDYKKATAYIQSCDRATSGESVYTNMKTLYLSVANQFVGYIQPNLLESVHEIADTYLSSNVSSENTNATQYFRDAIYNSTVSVVASNAGNQVTYAYALADCMNTLVGTTTPTSAANKAATANCLTKPDGPVASVRQIVYGYLQQIDGVLPPQIAAKIEQTGISQLNTSDANYTAEVDYLHQVFLQTDVGPAYVTCYETFVNCLFNNATGALAHPRNTQQTCLLGNACKTAPDGTANPYAGMRRSIQARLELAHRRVAEVGRTWGTARVVRKRGGSVKPRETFLLATIEKLSAIRGRSLGAAREMVDMARVFRGM